ncbi:MAG: hypothetical protein ABI321_11600 [Polyangia bacterium]
MADKPRERGRTDGNTSTSSESVADYAKREMAEAAERARTKQVYWENQKRVAAELPERFYALARQIRAHVDTFNGIVEPGNRVTLNESVGLAARAEVGRADLNLSLSRKKQEAWVGLSELMRLGHAPTAFLIEAQVKLSLTTIRVRAEGLPTKEGTIRYRVTTDGKEAPFGIDELAERIVLAVVKDDPAMLNAAPGPT